MASSGVTLLALALRLGTGLDLEVAAGRQPTSGTDRGEETATVTAVPRVDAGLLGSRQRLELAYFPRFFWRYPDSLALGRPTFLHQASATWDARLSTLSSVSLELGGVYGEADFTATQAVFGTQQLLPPEERVLRVLRLYGSAQGETALSRRTTLSWRLPAAYQASPPSETTQTSLPTLKEVGLHPGLRHTLTRRDVLEGELGATGFESDAARFVQTRLFASWAHVLTPRLRSRLGAGAARADRIDAGAPAEPAHHGLAGAGLDHQRRRGSESIELTLDARVDPLRGLIRPRANATVSVTERPWPGLGLSSGVFATTVATRGAIDPEWNETAFGGQFAATLRLAAGVDTRLGFRAGWAGPHWSEGLRPRQRTVLGFVGLTLTYPERHE